MYVSTQSLADKVSNLTHDLELSNLNDLLDKHDGGNDLLIQLVRLIELLSNQGNSSSYNALSFRLYYLQVLLGKDVDITKMVDTLCNDLDSLEGIGNIDEKILGKLINNIKGRLRRLSPLDKRFHTLSFVLLKLGGKVPSDILMNINKVHKSIQ